MGKLRYREVKYFFLCYKLIYIELGFIFSDVGFIICVINYCVILISKVIVRCWNIEVRELYYIIFIFKKLIIIFVLGYKKEIGIRFVFCYKIV